jgi:hypothetical protein
MMSELYKIRCAQQRQAIRWVRLARVRKKGKVLHMGRMGFKARQKIRSDPRLLELAELGEAKRLECRTELLGQ